MIETICVGASAGGHMNELLRLLEHSENWPVTPSLYITTQEITAEKLKSKGKTFVIGETNRYHPIATLKIFIQGLNIMKTEKPDLIISTGSLPMAMICLAGKVYGKKVIWIDSIANTEKFSVSGRLMYHFADLFLTQWQDLAEKFPKSEYAGALL